MALGTHKYDKQKSKLHNRTVYPILNFAVDSRYELVKVLGKGTYGIVCSFNEVGSEEKIIAVKKVQQIFKEPVLVKRALRELRLMSALRGHKNVS